jgi:hypothetical protein
MVPRPARADTPSGGLPGERLQERHRDTVLALLADPDPDVRREAVPLADGVVPILARWRAETDPAMRLPVLLQLGEAAGEEDAGAVEEVRTVLGGVLRDGEPVMKVAALISWARLDPQEPVRRIDLLVETLSDLAVRPRFEEIWYVSDVEEAFLQDEELRAAIEYLLALS